jgi:hypothetical protein
MVGVSVGACVVLSGVVVFASQVASWLETAHWQEYSLLDLIVSPEGKALLPLWLSSWLKGPERSSLHGLIIWVLDTGPASLGLITLGVLIMWKTVRW